jgi:transposase
VQVIGVDPHKGSYTAAVVSASGEPVDEVRVVASGKQLQRLLGWAQRWPDRCWAVEGARGVGRLLAQQLVAAGEQVVDVPAALATRVRVLSGSSGRKSDSQDARAVAIAAMHAAHLSQVTAEDHSQVLRLLAERRQQLSPARTQAVARLHQLLAELLPGGAKRRLSADTAAALLRRIKAEDTVTRCRRDLARELLEDLRRLDRRLADNEARTRQAVAVSGSTLTEIQGIGPLVAGRILGHVGDVTRFADRAHFAAYSGAAPIEASSGTVQRHRLSRNGNRQLNSALHTMAITQMVHPGAGRDYYRRKISEGKTPGEARRALKRHLANVIYARLVADHQRAAASPGGHVGAALTSSAADSTPSISTSDKSLPGLNEHPTPQVA